MLRLATRHDADAICAIYNLYVRDTTISFEESAVSSEEMAERINKVVSSNLPWFVIDNEGEIAGYAYATPWRVRHAYRYSVETSVYLNQKYVGKGLGTLLYHHLFDALRQRGIHSVIAGIAQPNPASVTLHEKLGMKKVAHFKEVGFKFDRWIDVGYWELQLA
ncbi:arsinothricin resistance N-acetyltransferase ArsN1 family B [Undibacterium sp. RuRC25W]|uniref:arsinothricin resistance N-acetyltransferase ArsN1 family B n=1 Tax=Undibacterium sp. RuRC25W TaxID=3413047 RepID=UPI003BF1E72D